ncbi:MAG: AMP-binding protein [Pseudomonadales bacterium]|nr:AMP-binding protein [Pseudomonadales bacterium]
MDFHFATAFEAVAQQYPKRLAAICDGKAVSWEQYEQRAAKVASLLADNGIGAGSKAALYLHNSNEYLEAQFGIFKIGGCPINVNYRYKSEELLYLLENSDAEVVFFQACYAMRIWEIKDRLPQVKLFVQVSDGTEGLMDFAVDYERSLRGQSPLAPIDRDANDIYMLYTGGTTGLPKGVMYPVGGFAQFFVSMGAAGLELEPPTNMAGYPRLLEQIAAPPKTVVGCPMMHGTGMWLGGFLPQLLGGTVISTSKLGLDPDLLWSLVEDYRATDIVIVGDAFARPMLNALNTAKERGTPYEIDSLRQITSSGVMWSQETKQGLLEHHDLALIDIMGSTEGGMGSSVTTREGASAAAKFEINDGVKVIGDDGQAVAAGSGTIGRIATSAFVPLGYYKDEEKSAATFQEIDGVRYSFPGDYATVEADGSITLLGRGSACINTGGEKVFPEEVEEAIKRHPSALDCLVVGLPSERFGESVTALVSLRDYKKATVDELMATAKDNLAGYKAPKDIFVVETVKRAPNGKADYKWARSEAEKRSTSGQTT